MSGEEARAPASRSRKIKFVPSRPQQQIDLWLATAMVGQTPLGMAGHNAFLFAYGGDGFTLFMHKALGYSHGPVGGAYSMTLQEAKHHVKISDADAFSFKQPAFGDVNFLDLEVTFFRNGRHGGPKIPQTGTCTYVEDCSTPPPAPAPAPAVAPAEYDGFTLFKHKALGYSHDPVGGAYPMTLQQAMDRVKISDADSFMFEKPASGDANVVDLEVTFFRNGRHGGPKLQGSIRSRMSTRLFPSVVLLVGDLYFILCSRYGKEQHFASMLMLVNIQTDTSLLIYAYPGFAILRFAFEFAFFKVANTSFPGQEKKGTFRQKIYREMQP